MGCQASQLADGCSCPITIHANPKAAGARKGFPNPSSNDGHDEGLAGDGLSEWHPAFLPGWGSKLLGRDPSAGSSSSGLGKGGAGQWRQASKFCRRMAVGRWRPYRRIGSKRPSISGA